MELKADNLINIHNFLPHRKPMLMADYILELTPETVITSFDIKPDNIFVFNNEFVEAGLIENAAQTAKTISFILKSNLFITFPPMYILYLVSL